MEHLTTPLLLLNVFLLGLVHGFDWDHVAAIADMTRVVAKRGHAFLLATLYIVGHALVVIVLGMGAILFGLLFPAGLDSVMERMVGVTLILLAVWLICALFSQGQAPLLMRSRWMLAIDGLKAAAQWTSSLFCRKPHVFQLQTPSAYGTGTAFAVGVLHGIGAETAIQALLFLGVSGSGGKGLGALMLLIFVMGLVISNTIITLAFLLGHQMTRQNPQILRVAGGLVAVFSLSIGVLFIAGQGQILPAIIPGLP